MKDMDRITKWINTILQEVSNLKDGKGIELLHSCGRECSKASDLLEGAANTRKKFADDDFEQLFQAFKKQYYNSSGFSKNGNKITLIFEECTCPMVKEGLSNSYLCHCTLGYSMQIFETLFNKPIEIKLLKSILKGDDICEQEILIKDA
jgi:predicted hydrocarbon binding protein